MCDSRAPVERNNEWKQINYVYYANLSFRKKSAPVAVIYRPTIIADKAAVHIVKGQVKVTRASPLFRTGSCRGRCNNARKRDDWNSSHWQFQVFMAKGKFLPMEYIMYSLDDNTVLLLLLTGRYLISYCHFLTHNYWASIDKVPTPPADYNMTSKKGCWNCKRGGNDVE